MKRILLVLSGVFCFLTSFSPAATEGDVAWIVSPMTEAIVEGRKADFEVTIYKTYGEFRELDVKPVSSDPENFPVSEKVTDNDYNMIKYQVTGEGKKAGNYTITITISGKYNNNGIKNFNQSKTVKVAVVRID